MIRPATPDDSNAVAPLMILALGHIAGIFANSENYEDGNSILLKCFSKETTINTVT